MMYQGSAAYQLDVRQTQALPVRRPLSVVEGGRGRATRTAVSPATVVMFVAALSICLAVLGAVRIALTTATVTSLRQIERAEMTVEEERNTMTELQVERSALSSADRIQRIATENYGMVYASEVDTVTIDLDAQQASDGSAEDAQSAEDGDSASPQA